jgi:apoptotic protease-activating factor
LKHLRRGQFLCLHSKIGFGKRWLASDACIDFNIVKHMGYKIFWVNVSKCTTPDAILEKLHRLKIILHAADDVDEKFYNCGNANIQNEIVNMKRHLRNVLESDNYKNCLLVISDVQDRETYKAFDLHCKILMTTKYVDIIDEISKESKYIVNVSEGFSEEESFSLLSHALDVKIRELPPQANVIHEKCQGYPFIIALIANNFAEFSPESSDRRNRRWQNWVSKLNNYQ